MPLPARWFPLLWRRAALGLRARPAAPRLRVPAAAPPQPHRDSALLSPLRSPPRRVGTPAALLGELRTAPACPALPAVRPRRPRLRRPGRPPLRHRRQPRLPHPPPPLVRPQHRRARPRRRSPAGVAARVAVAHRPRPQRARPRPRLPRRACPLSAQPPRQPRPHRSAALPPRRRARPASPARRAYPLRAWAAELQARDLGNAE